MDYAFRGCTGLVSITTPDSVICIGSYAFEDLSDITFIGTKEQLKPIRKEGRWYPDTASLTVHCTDGDIM